MKDILQVGEYCRTSDGRIFKVSEVVKFGGINYIPKDENKTLIVSAINKHSKNIIDLIEVGDVIIGYTDVSKYEVIGKNGEYIETLEDRYVTINDIKSIVTKEQFENISYKVEKE